jgi:hypothetical protein
VSNREGRGGHYNVDALCVFAPARVRVVNSARRASILARTSSNEVSQVQHRHVAPEAAYQRSLAILAATRTQTADEAHHAVGILGERWRAREVGARWRAGDHFMSLALRRGGGPRRLTLGAGGFLGGRTDPSSRVIISSAGALLFRPSGLRKRALAMTTG